MNISPASTSFPIWRGRPAGTGPTTFAAWQLVAGARDYHQAQIANAQNEVMKRLTVIASLLLVPTFIVGLYGQNFDHMPELHWWWGYYYSLGLIVVTTIAQLAYFRWKRWM